MSAVEALKVARAAGIHLGIDGDDLVLEASAPPHPAVIDLLSRHKAGIVSLLRSAKDGMSAEDWQVLFDERAGIAEFEGGLPRPQAEAQAFVYCVDEWLSRNPDVQDAVEALTEMGLPSKKPTARVQRIASPAIGEPSLDEPCAERRGRVEKRDGQFLHFCVTCGAWGAFGYGVSLRAGRLGRWYCAAHRPPCAEQQL
jgi:hypothetical protein